MLINVSVNNERYMFQMQINGFMTGIWTQMMYYNASDIVTNK